MALNQNSHRRNQQLIEQQLAQLRANQRKHNVTPEDIKNKADQANDYANMAGRGVRKVGEMTGNEKITNFGQKIVDNTGQNLKNKAYGFAKDKANSAYNFAKDKIASLTNKGATPPTTTPPATTPPATTPPVTTTSSQFANPAIQNAVATEVGQTGTNAGLSTIGNSIATQAPSATTVGTAGVGTTAGTSTLGAGTAATTAGTTAGTTAATTAGSSALAGGASAGAGAGASAAAGGSAATGAAAGASAIPVAGWIAAAAILAAQLGSSIYQKEKQKAHEKSQGEAQKSIEASLVNTDNIKQSIANKRNQIQGQIAQDTGVQMPTKQDITREFVQPAEVQEPEKDKGFMSNIADAVKKTMIHNKATEQLEKKVPMLDSLNESLKEQNDITGQLGEVAPAFKDAKETIGEQNEYISGGLAPTSGNAFEDANLMPQKEEGQMTGGAAPIQQNAQKPMFENTQISPRNYFPNTELREKPISMKERVQRAINANPQLKDDINANPMVKFPTRSLTPEEEARYREAQAIQNEGNQQIIDNIAAKREEEQRIIDNLKANAMPRRPNNASLIPEGTNTSDSLPPLPKSSPVPSRGNFNPNEFEIIEPYGRSASPVIPTGQPQVQTQPQTVNGFATDVPIEKLPEAQQPVKPQAEPIPYGEKANTVADIFRRVRQGWDENTSQTFNPSNLSNKEYQAPAYDKDGNVIDQTMQKNAWNRVGEGVGTAQKVLSNPLLQGLIAGSIYRATGGDKGESIRYGVDWAQNKNKSDFYQKQLDPNAKPGLLGGYTAEDWKTQESIANAKASQKNAEASLEERRESNRIRQEELNWKREQAKLQAEQKIKEEIIKRQQKAQEEYQAQVQAQRASAIKAEIDRQIANFKTSAQFKNLSPERQNEVISQFVSQFYNYPGLNAAYKQGADIRKYYGI